MSFDLELALVIGALLTGVIWLLDVIYLRRKRRSGSESRKDPWYVEYARSFFPVLLVVLVLRSFVAEPFRIPSGSMMPTLLVGDFILVNKAAYGLQLPVTHTEVLETGEPKRGDVAVFRFPENPQEDYIKRIVGLPGDDIRYRNKALYVNGKPVPQAWLGRFDGEGLSQPMMESVVLREDLFEAPHKILLNPQRPSMMEGEWRVPPDHYFVLGDNRDNSNDSRFWGFVPAENLVGRAFIIWMNWDIQGGVMDLSRVGQHID